MGMMRMISLLCLASCLCYKPRRFISFPLQAARYLLPRHWWGVMVWKEYRPELSIRDHCRRELFERMVALDPLDVLEFVIRLDSLLRLDLAQAQVFHLILQT